MKRRPAAKKKRAARAVPMGKVEIDRELCKGCSFCVISCPRGVLGIEPGLNRTGYFPAGVKDGARCTGCALCALMCPEIAITVWRENSAP